MKMLRNLGLVVLVVCIAAFASGGGGGGGAAAPVMECPQGQVGTYPDCMDPGPTDEERIAEARNTIAGIVNQANAIEQAARSAVTAVESSADATDEDIADARSHGNAALDALRAIIRASGVANAATTGAQAEGAVASANAALGRLNVARTAAVGIQNRVEAVANLREQQATEDRLATNGSSLIQHVRENKLVYDGILEILGVTGGANADPLVVGATDTANNFATFPANDTTSIPRVVGVRGVTAEGISSESTTPTLSGTGRLPHGFDLKQGTKYVNVYTDIAQTRKNVPQRRTGDNPATDTVNEAYNHVYTIPLDVEDADYLVAGIWLDGNVLKAFAYGSQPLGLARDNDFLECLGVPTSTSAPEVTCTDVSSFSNIEDFVDDGKDVSATYTGNANGAYLTDGTMSYFEADVTLNAEFRNPTGTGAGNETNGSIEGAITNIVAGGKSVAGSIELQKPATDFGNDISGAFNGAAIGVVAGKSFGGAWKGQFFGQKVSRAQRPSSEPLNSDDDPATSTTTFSAQAPGSVAGTFYVKQQSAPVGDAAFIGSFGAHR